MPNSPLATGSQTRLALVREAAFNTIPASPVFQIVRPSSIELANDPQFTQSKEIRSDGMMAGQILVDQDITMKYGSELSLDSHDDRFEEAFRNTRVKSPEIVKSVAEVGAVVVTTGVYNVGAGLGTPFLVGHLVQPSNFAIAVNNTKGRATATAANTVTIGGTTTVAEATPPVGARLKVVGQRAGVAGAISATAAPNTLVVATVNPSLLYPGGSLVNKWLRLSGFTGTLANNDLVRVSSVSGSGPWTLTLDVVPTGWATDTAAGQIVDMYYTDFLVPGNTRLSVAAEEAHLDLTLFKYLTGNVLNTLAVSMRQSDIVGVDIDFVGAGPTANAWQAQVATPTYLAAKTTTPINTSKNLGKTFLDTAFVTGVITSADFTFKPNPQVDKALGTFGAADITYGPWGYDLSISKYFLSVALNNKMMAGTPVNIVLVAYDPANGGGYVFDFRSVVLQGGQPSVPDATKPLEEPYKAMGQVDPTSGIMCGIYKFESAPAVGV